MGDKNFEGTNLRGGGGVKKFGPFRQFRFPTIVILPTFWAVCKNLPNCREEKYGNTGCHFCSSFAIFVEL